MRFISSLLIIFTLIATIGQPAHAAEKLTFESKEIAVTVKPNAKIVSIPFEFENKTAEPVEIARYDSACSCISARVVDPPGQMTFKPGEKGKIVVDFSLGSFSGLQKKTLMLWIKGDPAETPSIILTSLITIPVLFEVTPKTLFWDQHGDSAPQKIRLIVHNDKPIHLTKHTITNKDFTYEIKTIRDGREYEIIVTPKTVARPGMGMIKLTTDAAIPRYQRQLAFVCVRKGKTKK